MNDTEAKAHQRYTRPARRCANCQHLEGTKCTVGGFDTVTSAVCDFHALKPFEPIYPKERIREIMITGNGRNQKHCAETIGVTRVWLNKMINGSIPFSDDFQRRISDYLAVYK